MNKVMELARRLRTSVWASLALKALGGVVVLSLLALFGAGVGDRFFDPGTAHAARDPSRTRAPSARATASANLAAEVSDVPTTRLHPETARAAPSTSTSTGPRGTLPDGRVVLNEASAEQIDKLPGIGLKKAHSIVELRTKLGGRFKRLEDLTRVKGIKRKAIEKLRPHVVLDAPAAAVTAG